MNLNYPKQSGTQDQKTVSSKEKALAGTDDKPWWEKAADTIAGDNKLLNTAMRSFLNPLVLIAALVGGVFYYTKSKEKKELIDKLQKENEGLKKSYEELEEEYHKLKKKHKKLKALHEPESSLSGVDFMPQQGLSAPGGNRKAYQTLYLD